MISNNYKVCHQILALITQLLQKNKGPNMSHFLLYHNSASNRDSNKTITGHDRDPLPSLTLNFDTYYSISTEENKFQWVSQLLI